ncbi:MAG: hypothetical protein HC933_00825 [Pleurocapsa sp. SU_196_0]|nr:hypothetical protein [Pleurocapsa sp. SU_196_0]
MTWTFSDGTRLALGGFVTGTSLLAKSLRLNLSRHAEGDKELVMLVAPDSIELDTGNAWIMHQWALEAAEQFGLTVTTNKPVDDSHAPREARAYFLALESASPEAIH